MTWSYCDCWLWLLPILWLLVLLWLLILLWLLTVILLWLLTVTVDLTVTVNCDCWPYCDCWSYCDCWLWLLILLWLLTVTVDLAVTVAQGGVRCVKFDDDIMVTGSWDCVIFVSHVFFCCSSALGAMLVWWWGLFRSWKFVDCIAFGCSFVNILLLKINRWLENLAFKRWWWVAVANFTIIQGWI